jgi:hypothetical protein
MTKEVGTHCTYDKHVPVAALNGVEQRVDEPFPF